MTLDKRILKKTLRENKDELLITGSTITANLLINLLPQYLDLGQDFMIVKALSAVSVACLTYITYQSLKMTYEHESSTS